nr:nucleotidyltransferase family protein [Stappia taiwanensis]
MRPQRTLRVVPRPADRPSLLPLDRRSLGDPSLTSERDRRCMLELLIRTDETLMGVLRTARDLALPDWRLVSGAVYQSVWNALTGRRAGHGIKDFDLVYFDASDLGFEAEDRVIARAAPLFAGVGRPVEIRNQARVHLWFEKRFGVPYAPLRSADEALLRYAARTHAVGVRLCPDDRLDIVAPFGLADIFAMRLVPNLALDNRRGYAEKARRMKVLWPELEVLPWPEGASMEASAEVRPVSASSRDWMSVATSPRTELPK